MKEQAKGPLLNPIEHGLNEAELVQKVQSNAEYKQSFEDMQISVKELSLELSSMSSALLSSSKELSSKLNSFK